ncbi:Panacea domain-containing protein [Megasphaera sp. UPII 135-E]|uniref:Panacea domain-containing protein n=1 Tax=Megasphaera sp. UPII 135-E TaxID=1000569 RepID=UPI00021A3453|nr:type II toxin-antitoxin system antitoxin SocA domain-containing protein [Megasphaera sp. UPII 135-E]EGS34892.1 hypothetical protein HMPREF1040_1612 [Megasphaera sp. UPII 135-E]MUP49057.1 DUF4065 domain-containing protein [Veillonellaceae bacterium M2-8]MUP59876.1 DUF4065 domain-containing protein [Veillonellaceae bacterium M2-4]
MQALDLVKYIVTKCTKDNCSISNLQLQKILYYIQVWFLKNTNQVAFPDEIQAWQFGPVVPEVYYYFCGFGAMPIFSTYDIQENILHKNVIDDIVTNKRAVSPWDLVEDTHDPEKAWKHVYGNGEGNYLTISIQLLKEIG